MYGYHKAPPIAADADYTRIHAAATAAGWRVRRYLSDSWGQPHTAVWVSPDGRRTISTSYGVPGDAPGVAYAGSAAAITDGGVVRLEEWGRGNVGSGAVAYIAGYTPQP